MLGIALLPILVALLMRRSACSPIDPDSVSRPDNRAEIEKLAAIERAQWQREQAAEEERNARAATLWDAQLRRQLECYFGKSA